MHVYSNFWILFCAGAIPLSPLFAERDDTPEPTDDMDMRVWLRLSEAERGAVVEGYAHRKPRVIRLYEQGVIT